MTIDAALAGGLAGAMLALAIGDAASWVSRVGPAVAQLDGAAGPPRKGSRPRGAAQRIEAAGLTGAIGEGTLWAARLGCAVLAWVIVTLLWGLSGPQPFGQSAQLAFALIGWGVPDFLLHRQGRGRKREIDVALPEILQATVRGMASGLSPLEALAAGVRHRRDPFSLSVQLALGRIERGEAPSTALSRIAGFRDDPRVAGFLATLERARRHGTDALAPVRAMALELQTLRRTTRAAKAARAAPLIQLVIALLFVPSVLLMLGAFAVARIAA